MTATPLPRARWDDGNVEHHSRKHTKCFERLLGVTGREITVSEYKARSQGAIDGSWAEFEADKLKHGQAAYFVDDELVLGVLTPDRRTFKSCFHEHFDRPARCAALCDLTAGARRLEFIRYLDAGEKGEVFVGVKRIRGLGAQAR